MKNKVNFSSRIFDKKKALEFLKKHFIGRTDTFIEYRQHWIRQKRSLIKQDVLDHLEGKKIIGTYPIYYKNKRDFENMRFRCRWICLDIDIHDDWSDEKKEELSHQIDVLLTRSKQYFLINRKYIIKEESRRGYHLWIILKKDTLLKKAAIYVEIIRPLIEKIFEDVEIFPKQTYEDFVNKNIEVGNGVRMPYAVGNKPLDINKIHELDISEIVRRYNKLISNTTYRKKTPDKEKPPNIIRSNKIGTVDDISLQRVYKSPFLRPCIKAVIDGSFQTMGSNGHLMRVAVANELLSLGLSATTVATAFANQGDYDYETSLNYVLYSQSKQNTKGRDLTFQCDTIQSLGYCIPDCHRRGASRKHLTPRKQPEQTVIGWDGLYEILGAIIKHGDEYEKYYKQAV
jgi:hypothetical protein